MRLAATPGQPTPPRWLADASTRLGVDNLTGFGVQDGCFEPNDPAQGLMLGNSDLWGGPIRMTRNVGGDTSLRGLPQRRPRLFRCVAADGVEV